MLMILSVCLSVSDSSCSAIVTGLEVEPGPSLITAGVHCHTLRAFCLSSVPLYVADINSLLKSSRDKKMKPFSKERAAQDLPHQSAS